MADNALADLEKWLSTGEVDTVLLCLVDMQGRLIGKCDD